MRKIIFTLIVALYSTTVAFSQTFDVKNLTFTILKNNEASVDKSKEPWSVESVTIPSTVKYKGETYTVTTIGYQAFNGCLKLTSVTIPNTVKIIGNQAFAKCNKLTSIIIPNSVVTIGNRVFEKCSRLSAITLPNSIKTIGEYTFNDCINLSSISIPDSVTSIERNLFENCKLLTSITIPSSVTVIGDYAFENCSSLKTITIPNSVLSIGNKAFQDCSSLTSITIPNSIKSINEGTFINCKGLTSVNIPNSALSIGNNAFLYCNNLKDITIPTSITAIGNAAFYGCSSLTSITIPNSVVSIGNSAFAYCNSLTSITIPDSITSIEESVFMYCINLNSITIPNSVTLIGDTAFRGCRSLTSVIIPNHTQYFSNSFRPETTVLTEEKIRLRAIRDLEERVREGRASLAEYVKYYVEPEVNKWQVKSEFEPTSVWNERVNETTRKEKIKALAEQYTKQYYSQAEERKKTAFKNVSMSLMSYDPDNQSFLIKMSSGDILLPVPLSAAPSFKSSWESVKKSATPQYTPSGDDVVLSAITFTHVGKSYRYDSKTQVKYAVTDIAYNFDPIDIGETKTVATTAGIGGSKANVESRSLSVGNISDVATNIPQTAIKNENTFVLIIANENYTSEAKVNFAINDGQTFKKYCERTLGVPVRNIKIVENATVGSMSTNISWLQRVLKSYGKDANAIIYYSGHGVPNEAKGDAYLLPTDITGADYQYAYSLDKLYKEMGETGAGSITYFIDACFSGSKRDGEMMVAARGVAIKAKSGVLSGNSVAFTASSGDETAFAYNEKGHGMFTYFLLKKLQESKGNVTYGELASYISTHVTRQSNIVNPKAQTPTVIPSPTLQSSWQGLKFAK